MAQNLTIGVPEGFSVQTLLEKVKSDFEAKEYTVTADEATNSITIEKGTENWFTKYIGLNEKVTANCSVQNNILTVNYDSEFTTKIIAIVAGVALPIVLTIASAILSLIPFVGLIIAMVLSIVLMLSPFISLALFITGGIGIYKQCTLPKAVGEAITLVVNGGPGVAQAEVVAPKAE